MDVKKNTGFFLKNYVDPYIHVFVFTQISFRRAFIKSKNILVNVRYYILYECVILKKKNIYFYRLGLPYKDGDKIMLETCEMPAIT